MINSVRTIWLVGFACAALLVGCTTSREIDWSLYPATASETDVQIIISEIGTGKTAAVSLFHGGRVEVYTKDYRYLKASTSDPQKLKILQDTIRAQGRNLMVEQE